MMKFTAQQIATLVGGIVEGDHEATVWQLSNIEDAVQGSISFLADLKYEPYLYTTNASIVIASKVFNLKHAISATLIRVDDPRETFVKLLSYYKEQMSRRVGISSSAYIASDAIIGENVYIGEFAVIESGVKIGDNTAIYPSVIIGKESSIGSNTTIFYGVKLYENTHIGNHCIIHAGTVIGADGFGFALQPDQSYMKIPQLGNVVIEDHVEIGANTTIDKATLGATIIKKGVKIDNLIQIAHNVVIDNNAVIAAQTGIAGSTKIGKNCIIGGQVGFIDHLTIGDNVKIAAQSGIGHNAKDNEILFGSPAVDAKSHKKQLIYLRNMEKIIKRIEMLEEKIKNM